MSAAFTRIVIPDLLLEEIIEHAREGLPNECCGLLAGHIADRIGIVTTRYSIPNALNSPTEYLSDAKCMLGSFRHMREHGLELLVVYHSHPASPPVPSRRDLERNYYGETVAHLIVSLAAEKPNVKAWWLGPTEFREVEMIVQVLAFSSAELPRK